MSKKAGNEPAQRGRDRRKMSQMLVLGLSLSLFSWLAGFREAAGGLLAGLPIGMFNYWLVASAVNKGEKDPYQVQALFMGRAIFRMLVALVALVMAVQVGIQFMVGVAAGLLTQMFTYFYDAWSSIRRSQ